MLKMRKNRNNKKGFTILELVCAIAIIIILMAIALPRYIGVQDQAKIAADKSSIDTINKCIMLHTAVNNFDNLVGQTSMNVFVPLKNGDSVTVIIKFLQDKGLLEDSAKVYFTQGHNYNSVENKVN